jgi:hypothetical protein
LRRSSRSPNSPPRGEWRVAISRDGWRTRSSNSPSSIAQREPDWADSQKNILKLAVMIGFALPNDRMHAPNEKFHLRNFFSGIATSVWFLAAIGSTQYPGSSSAKEATRHRACTLMFTDQEIERIL